MTDLVHIHRSLRALADDTLPAANTFLSITATHGAGFAIASILTPLLARVYLTVRTVRPCGVGWQPLSLLLTLLAITALGAPL